MRRGFGEVSDDNKCHLVSLTLGRGGRGGNWVVFNPMRISAGRVRVLRLEWCCYNKWRRKRSEREKDKRHACRAWGVSHWYLWQQREIPAETLVMLEITLLEKDTQRFILTMVWLKSAHTQVLVLYWGLAPCILLRSACGVVQTNSGPALQPIIYGRGWTQSTQARTQTQLPDSPSWACPSHAVSWQSWGWKVGVAGLMQASLFYNNLIFWKG